MLFADPKRQYLAHRRDIDDAVARVLAGGRYVLGEEVGAFEKEFASYCGVRYAIGVGNGTEALSLALRAAGVGVEDEVITVSHTAVATAAAVVMSGALPVYVDIDPSTFTLDPSGLENALTSKTRAIVPVHLYGRAANMDAICEFAESHGLVVIEDCAQAHGASFGGRRVGAWGKAGCFSFYPTKNLGAFGDGGAVVTDDPVVARRVRQLREYGWEQDRISVLQGWNSRLDEIQAAVLRAKLTYLDEDNAARRRIAAAYRARLHLPDGSLADECDDAKQHLYHLFVICVEDRDSLSRFLFKSGIGAGVHYQVPVHRQPAYRFSCSLPLPHTEFASARVLSLPIYPGLRDTEVDAVIAAVNTWLLSPPSGQRRRAEAIGRVKT